MREGGRFGCQASRLPCGQVLICTHATFLTTRHYMCQSAHLFLRISQPGGRLMKRAAYLLLTSTRPEWQCRVWMEHLNLRRWAREARLRSRVLWVERRVLMASTTTSKYPITPRSILARATSPSMPG